MGQTVEAVFENGIFKIVDPSALRLAEGQKVKLVVEEQPQSKEWPSELLASTYDGLSEQEIDEIERIALDRRDFFSRRIADLRLEDWPK